MPANLYVYPDSPGATRQRERHLEHARRRHAEGKSYARRILEGGYDSRMGTPTKLRGRVGSSPTRRRRVLLNTSPASAAAAKQCQVKKTMQAVYRLFGENGVNYAGVADKPNTRNGAEHRQMVQGEGSAAMQALGQSGVIRRRVMARVMSRGEALYWEAKTILELRQLPGNLNATVKPPFEEGTLQAWLRSHPTHHRQLCMLTDRLPEDDSLKVSTKAWLDAIR